jgi:predicted DNA-binding mobile mystery protein A
MEISKQKLLIEQADKKLAVFRPLGSITIPQKGWIHTVRVALKMSLRQLGNRLKISPQSVKEIEERESNGSITIKGLKEVGAALDMMFVYGFIPKGQSIEKMIEKRALEVAKEIVMRTSNTMQLEDQENSKERLEKAIKNRAEEIKTKMPRYIWD